MTPDDERLEQIKNWWKEFRWTIIGGTTLGVVAVGGWTGWNEYTRVEQEAASSLFQELSVAVVQADVSSARQAFDELLDGHSGSNYAEKARLLLARANYEAGEVGAARSLLEDAISKSSDDATLHTARIRLARLMIADAQFEAALDLLSVADVGQYESHYQELRGDAYRGMKRHQEAQDAYQASIDALGGNSAYQTILTLKLNDTLVQE